MIKLSSNNTNKLSPQERANSLAVSVSVQIIQINLALKNLVTAIALYSLFK